MTYQLESQKKQLKVQATLCLRQVPLHPLPIPGSTVHRLLQLTPPHTTDWVSTYCGSMNNASDDFGLMWQLYNIMLVHNSEDTCKTMSLHIRRFNASLYTHQSTNNVYKSQSSNSFSPSVSYLKVYKCTTSNTFSPGSIPSSQHYCSMGPLESTKRHWQHLSWVTWPRRRVQ